jgi:hypothetical protein
MSGPLSSEDIEDVVSSVRRLVSVDARPRPVTVDLGADRLILTPALRVVPEPAPKDPLILSPAMAAAAPAAEAEAQAGPDAPEAAAEAAALELAEAEAALTAALADPEPAPEGERPVAAIMPEEAPAPDTAVPAAAEPAEPAPLWPEAGAEAEPLVGAAADALAEPAEEAATLVEADWEDEIWSEADPPLAEIALEAEEAELVAPPAEADEAGVFADSPAAPPEAAAPWSDLESDWAEDVPDPVVPFRPVPRGEGKAAEATGRADPVPEPLVLNDAGALTDPEGNPLTILDEEALAEVVRQLIREELQGALGERITRNVRKLVRAEINRALTARELD